LRVFLADSGAADATIGFVPAKWLAPPIGAALLLALPTHASADTSAPGSVSCGAANRGALAGANAIPDTGEGFVTPDPWRDRGLRYATDELIGLIQRASAQVARQHGGTLGVADLSAERGGAVARHASHQSGRDADLIYYAIDRTGDPMPPDRYMAYYGVDGRSISAEAPEPANGIHERFFDLERNWALVTALVNDPQVRVYRIFVSTRVRDWLMAYAQATRAPADLVTRVRSVLSTARDTGTHQDHMHLRIACSADDVAMGRCSDDSVAPPRRRRGKRRRAPRPTKWFAHVRCEASSDALANGQLDRPEGSRRRSAEAPRSARSRSSMKSSRSSASGNRRARVKARPAAGR
jgi:penicillin-insensitive murein endopeptidase